MMTAAGLATLGGGCFWCTEAVFSELTGVKKVTSGYAGGTVENPTYEQICTGRTGHAEVVQIAYDPATIGYGDLLDIFFSTHDPTSLNRQGADTGTQYRSVIFFHDDEQRQIAEDKIRALNEEQLFPGPIVTQVQPVPQFWPAEGYHQRYFAGNSSQPYCRSVIGPKLAKLRQKFASRLRTST
jgi:peptide-methionine (S)-S-oxide reductase